MRALQARCACSACSLLTQPSCTCSVVIVPAFCSPGSSHIICVICPTLLSPTVRREPCTYPQVAPTTFKPPSSQNCQRPVSTVFFPSLWNQHFTQSSLYSTCAAALSQNGPSANTAQRNGFWGRRLCRRPAPRSVLLAALHNTAAPGPPRRRGQGVPRAGFTPRRHHRRWAPASHQAASMGALCRCTA